MTESNARWSVERAQAWQEGRSWRVGCNFAPSTASNPLEMWQASTFDPETFERELNWAQDLGLTSHRIFLHDLLWREDADGLTARVDRVLDLLASRGMGALLVLFDGVWDPNPKLGPQAEPRPGVHNSRWVQSPGASILGDPARHHEVAPFVQGVLDRFRDDVRIDGWDLFNEPDNPNLAYANQEISDKAERSLELLAQTFDWAREVDPSQPLTAGVWQGSWSDPNELSAMDQLCLDRSDIITFHHYGDLGAFQHRVEALRRYQRPIWCTEWLARGLGSCFDPHLGWMKSAGVGAYCWGFVAGRTQTHLPWESWVRPLSEEPDPWHHEILRANGEPYDEAEAAYIRALTLP